MDDASAVGGHLELIDEFRRRFPLFNRTIGRFGETTPPERIPWFFGFVLSAAMKSGPGACCFVLDKTAGTTAIAAILAALVRLQNDFPRLVEHYAHYALSRGQRVKVKPTDFVYEYEGPWDEFPSFFRLKVLGEDAWRSFPLIDVLRLEPTDRIRPKGTLTSDFGQFKRSLLDQLLDLTTCGNNSVILNAVLINMARTQFARVADAIILAPRHAPDFASLSPGFVRLSRFLPWGSVEHDGSLRPSDPYQVTGEPLLAVASVPEDLALACCAPAAERATKVVFVDGARRIVRDIQAFDDIVSRQRIVILASPEERDELAILKDRECPIWHMSAGEVLLGETSADNRSRASLVGATIRAAHVRRRARVRTVGCNDELLEAAAARLEQVTEFTSRANAESPDIDEVIARLFRVLFELSECVFGVGEETATDLTAATHCMTKYGKWFDKDVVKCFSEATAFLARAIDEGSGKEKAHTLLTIINEGNGLWSVAARSPRTATHLRNGLMTHGIDLPVLPILSMTTEHEYDGIILPAWPNDQRFTRLRNLSLTPEIRILTYPFESKWVLRHEARERAREQSNRMEARTRASILEIEPHFLSGLGAEESPTAPTYPKEISLDLPVFKLEDRVAQRQITQRLLTVDGEESREAHLIRFFGGCYALLTEWAELPILNDLIDGGKIDKSSLTVKRPSELSTGDFVLFRAGGDKEFVRLIAEKSLGADEYRRTRNVAERWKSALRRIEGGPAAIQRRLEDHGLKRTLPTIAGWLGNPDRIGPGDSSDLEVIAKAAADTELLSMKDEVKQAISHIRGAHLAAGVRLTKLILGELDGRLDELGEQPALLDLGYGQAWVVQVESVETKPQEYPANQVNRLLWSSDSAF